MTPTTATATSTNALLGVNAGSPSAAAASDAGDRFLKLLVTQMQNQDPLNPMDNAQVTSQMAQISTVSGIDKLNASIGGINSLLLQSQSLEGAGLVGKSVLLAGNQLELAADGSASGGFELAGAADAVTVSVKNAAGKVIDTLELGAESGGRHGFDWKSADAALTGLTFSVAARAGAAAVNATPLVADTVDAVYSDGGQLNVGTRNHGVVRYGDVLGVS